MDEQLARDVSKNCLRGQPVPGALGALWEAEQAGESLIGEMDYGEVELLRELPADLLHGYSAEFCNDPPLARAYERMFDQIAFFAREADGGLLGFWLLEQSKVANAPIIEVDNEGQFHVNGLNLQDHFVAKAHVNDFDEDGETVAAIRKFFDAHGHKTRSPEQVEASVAEVPDGNTMLDVLWADEREDA
jgi:hypothetical protein